MITNEKKELIPTRTVTGGITARTIETEWCHKEGPYVVSFIDKKYDSLAG